MQETGEESPLSLVGLNADVHEQLIRRLTLKDSIAVLKSCRRLRDLYKDIIVKNLYQIAEKQRIPPQLILIWDAMQHIAMNFDYTHLAKIMSCALPILAEVFPHLDNCKWQFAAICGYPSDNKGVLNYYALGGQLDFLKAHPLSCDAVKNLARLAAIGGHINVLKYLQTDLNFDLREIYFAKYDSCHRISCLLPSVDHNVTYV